MDLLLEPASQRRVMGLFATGVSVLTTYTARGEAIGMTANSLTSVSLDPMLLLVCVWKEAAILPHLLHAGAFGISLLGSDQADLSGFFAGMWGESDPPKFRFEDWGGVPRLSSDIGAIRCRCVEQHEGGTHWIVIGEITGLARPEPTPDPLIFYSGGYRRLAD